MSRSQRNYILHKDEEWKSPPVKKIRLTIMRIWFRAVIWLPNNIFKCDSPKSCLRHLKIRYNKKRKAVLFLNCRVFGDLTQMNHTHSSFYWCELHHGTASLLTGYQNVQDVSILQRKHHHSTMITPAKRVKSLFSILCGQKWGEKKRKTVRRIRLFLVQTISPQVVDAYKCPS